MKWYPMNRRAFLAAIAFLGALAFFGLSAPSPFSLPTVSPAYAQSAEPEFPPGEITRSVDENTDPYEEIGAPVTATGDGITYSLENAGTSHFGIDYFTGQLLVGAPLDHEAPEAQDNYTVTVIATDSSGRTAEKEVTITVTDLDEASQVKLSWVSVSSGVKFTAYLDEPDAVSVDPTWQWSESNNQNSGYTNIATATSAAYTRPDSATNGYLRVTATYTDAHVSNRTASKTLEVELPDGWDGYAPVFDINTSGGYECNNGEGKDLCIHVKRNVTPGDDIYYPASIYYKNQDEPNRYRRSRVSYSLGGTDASFFGIDPDNGELLAKGDHIYETQPTYDITITATDPDGATASITLRAKRSGGSAGLVVEGPTRIKYPENGTWRIANYRGSLPGPRQTHGWIIGVQPGGGDGDFFRMDDDGTLYFRQPPDFEDPADDNGDNQYSFFIHAYDTNPPDGRRPAQTYYNVTVVVENSDEDLEIRGLTSVKFPENSTDAVATYTAQGAEGTLEWMLSGQDSNLLDINNNGELTFKQTPDYENPFDASDPPDDRNDYLLSVTVTDGNESKSRDPVRVMVTNVNEAPVFPSEATTITVSEDTLSGTDIGTPILADDPDVGDSPQYSLSGTDATSFTLGDYSGQLQTAEALDFSNKQSYTVVVTATDGDGLTDTITVTIGITDVDYPPAFANTTDTRSVDENTAADTNIGAPITADDPDTTTLTYTLEGTDAASFDIDSASGQLKTKSPLDHETKSTYSVTVNASDGTMNDTITVTITVNDVNEDPEFPSTETSARSVPENTGTGQNIGTPVYAADPDNGDTLTYSLGGTDSASFDIVTTSGQLQTKAALDQETKSSYEVTVSVRDSKDSDGSPDTATDNTITVTITVTGENDPPEFDANLDVAPTIDENTPPNQNIGNAFTATDPENDTLTYTLDDVDDQHSDAEHFNIISTTGQLRTKGALNFETQDSYMVQISVKDGKANGNFEANDWDDTITVTITVTNEDEAGTVTLSPGQPQVGTDLTATLSEPDGVVSGTTWRWESSANGSTGWATVTGATDAVTTSSYTPVEADLTMYLKATVSYTDPQGPSKSAEATTVNAVQAAPITNEAPAFPSTETGAREVAENTGAGADIGAPVAATDANTGDTLTYSLGGTDGAAFDIDTSTGQLRVGVSTTLDYETKSTYSVTVSVSDSKNADGESDAVEDHTITVTITVTNEDEAGTVTLSPGRPQVGTELTATLEDPDGTVSNTTWLWESSANGSTGWATVTGATDTVTTSIYTPVDADFDKHLRATATYTDGHGGSKSADAVSANPVNAAPVFSEPTATRAVNENTPTGTNFDTPVTATDADTLTYKLGGTDAASFRIVEPSGQLQTESALNFEGKSSYEVTVIATDASEASTSIPVTITVNNLEEAGTVTLTLLQPQVGTAQTATLTDPDKNPSRVSWQWARGDSATGSFTNVSSGADPGSYTPVSADVGKYLRATATYDDDHGPGKSAHAVSDNPVQAAPATNSPPDFSAETASRSVAENTDAGEDIGTPVTASDAANDTLTYSLGGDDADSFDIVRTSGQLQTKAPLDFETTPSYTVTVTATDPSKVSDTITVTITVGNVDEEATVTLSSIQPQVGTELTATLTDPDGATSNVTWQWGRGAVSTGPFPNISSGASYTPTAPDVGKFLQATATYTDPQGGNKTADGVSVNAVQAAPSTNIPPVFLAASASRSVAEDAITGANIGTPVKATDADNDKLTYTLSGTDAAFFGIVDTSGQLQTTAALDYETTPSYTVTVTATNPSGLFGSITVTISVGNVDEPGTVSISPAQPQVGTALTAMLTDPDGNTSDVTWQWTKADATSAYADISSGRSYTPTAADEGKYLKATASYTDPQGSGKSADAVSANAVQAAPIVNVKPAFSAATATRTVAENTAAGQDIGAPVTATDANTGDTLTYTLEGTDAASFDIGESTGQLQTKAELDFEDKASYTVTVSVRDSKDADGNADTATDDSITVTITVTDVNEPPEFPSSETGTRTVPENTPANTDIGYPVAATDLDSDTLTYTLEGTDAASFAIDSSTGQLKTKDALDFEAKPTLLVTVKADDSNGSTDTITVTITVTDVNDAPAFSAETDTRTIPENTASGQNIGSPVAATDQDSGNTLTYTLGGDDADSFTVISTSGQLQTKAELDHETKPSYTVTVSVRDNKGDDGSADTATDDTIVVTITVTDVNESPVVADTPNTNYAENDTGPVATYTATDPDQGTKITWILAGDDKDDFELSDAGVLTFKTPPDYEDPEDTDTNNVYVLTVKASDGLEHHTLSVTVTVTNVDEAGTVSLTSFYPQVGTELTATLSDPDGTTSGVTWKWESTSDRDLNDWAAISGADAKAYTPVDGDLGKYLRVTASYTDPEGPGKSAHSETTDPVRAAPVTNVAPVFSEDAVTRTVAENTVPGEDIGGPVTATDTDDKLTYALGGADAASFDIDQLSGQLKTKAALDHETKETYTVTVTATDPSSATDTITVTINVTDVAPPPAPDAAPTVEASATDGHFKLDVTWTAVNPGSASPVTGYGVQYQVQGATDGWSADDVSVSDTSATIVSLTPNTPYDVQVQATSVEGPSGWSPSGTGSTNQLPLTVAYEKATYPVNEGGSVEVKVTLSPETNRYVDVPIAVKEETAETQDYQVEELTGDDKLPFAPGDNFKTFTIKTKGDSDTSDETITLEFDELGLPDHVILGTQKKAMVTIKDTTPNNPGNTGGSPSPPPPPPQMNDPPVFSGGRIARSVAENTAPGTDIGEPVEATDAADDSLTYSLSGDDGASFDINQTTGQLQTKDALDHETQGTYTVMVTATDPSTATATATVDVTINVTDIDEKPGKPEAPELEPEATDGHSKLTVTWDPPANTGPDLTSYTSAHRKHGVQEWTTKTITVTTFADAANPTLNIIDLLPDTKYFARVQATSDEGTGEWSDEGSGTTATKPEADWLELTVDYAAATYSVTEGSTVTITVDLSAEADRKLAIPITVTPGTAETGDYTVSGLTGNALPFVPGESSKTFEISASRDNDGADETVDLGFGSPLPTKVTAGTLTASQVTIDDNYRGSSGGGGGGGGTPPVKNPPPPANNPPVFNPGTVETVSVPENTVAGTDIGDPVTAVDSDANDTLTYSLDTASATVFTIVAGTGQLQTKGALNYEVKNRYTVTVTATDSSGAEATTDVTINITDMEEPPGKPNAPTVGPASTNGHNTLSVSWNAPYNTGPAITSYTVEYRKHDSTRWTADNLTITGATATITSLLPDTRYAATVRATNDEGTGKWSNEGYGSTEAIPVSEHLDLTVNYQAAAYTVTEGSSVTVTVTLSTAADRALAIPIAITAGSAESGDYTAVGLDGSNALAFASGESSKAFTITANSDADTDDETLDLGFGTLPAKVTAGATAAATVTINDQIVTLPQRTVSYGAASYTVNEGSSATIDVTLSQAADRALSVPITVTRGTAEARDYEVSGLTGGGVAFSQGAGSGSFTITAAQDEDSSNETLSLGFGTMPGGVSAGSPATASVTIDDDDPPVVYNPPPRRRGGGSSRRRGSGGWVMGSENYPPVFMEGPTASREVPEIARKAANIGYPVTATDPNLDKLTYTLTGDDRDSFDIGTDTGQLLTKAPLDFETRPGYAVGVTVSDGRGGSDSIEVSIGVTDLREREISSDRDTQTVARVIPGVGATIVTPDGSGTVALPAGSRDSDYYVRIGSGANACARDAPPGDLYVYTTVEIFDLQGNLEEDVTLDQPAVILLKLDAGKLGGVADALAIHEAGGIRVYRRAGPQEAWAEVDFTLVSDDEGGITVFVTGVLQFGCFVAVADTSVLPPPAAPAADPTPEPTPQPVAVPVVDDVPPAPPAAATGPKAEPVYPPVSRPLLTTPLSIDGAAPLSIFGAVEKFARDIPLWVLMMLLIASAAWSVGVYAYDVWRRNHPPPPKWRSDVAEIGRDVLVPTG